MLYAGFGSDLICETLFLHLGGTMVRWSKLSLIIPAGCLPSGFTIPVSWPYYGLEGCDTTLFSVCFLQEL